MKWGAWQNEIDVSDLWETIEGDPTDEELKAFCSQLARRLALFPWKKMSQIQNDNLNEVIHDLKELGEGDYEISTDDVDDVLERLFDWADYNKTAWIKQF